ncbi:MAG: AIR synthase-related protein, partial [Pseudorhodoplanes sp.]
SVSLTFKNDGDAILIIGETAGWLGQSLYLRDVCGREEGAPPPVDLAAEKRNGDLVRDLIAGGLVNAVHDLSDGGLAVALAEMAMASGRGARLEAAPAGIPPHAFWFGEDQARYVVTAPEGVVKDIMARAGKAGVPARRLGAVAGDALILPGERPILVAGLSERFEGWLPGYMAGNAA